MSIIYCHENDEHIDTDFPNECEECTKIDCPYNIGDNDEEGMDDWLDAKMEEGWLAIVDHYETLEEERLDQYYLETPGYF